MLNHYLFNNQRLNKVRYSGFHIVLLSYDFIVHKLKPLFLRLCGAYTLRTESVTVPTDKPLPLD